MGDVEVNYGLSWVEEKIEISDEELISNVIFFPSCGFSNSLTIHCCKGIIVCIWTHYQQTAVEIEGNSQVRILFGFNHERFPWLTHKEIYDNQ